MGTKSGGSETAGSGAGEAHGAPMIPGFPAIGAAAGLAGGLAATLLCGRLGDGQQAGLIAPVAAFTAVFLLIVRRGRIVPAACWALGVAMLLTLHIVLFFDASRPPFQEFWSLVSLGVTAYLATAFAAAIIAEGAPPRYRAFYPAALTLPIIAVGAILILALGALIAYPVAKTLGATGAIALPGAVGEGGDPAPANLSRAVLVLGATAVGFAIGLLRSMEAFLSAARFALLWITRIAAPLVAVALIGLAVAGVATDLLEGIARQGGFITLLAPAFIAIAVFGGVYQNGEGPPPPPWLRISIVAILVGYPVYMAGVAFSFWESVPAEGLSAPYVPALCFGAMASAYAIVCIAGLVSEARRGADRWMPVVAPLNTTMALFTMIVFTFLATPVPWASLTGGGDAEPVIEDEPVAAEPSERPSDPEEGVMGLELNPAGNPDREEMFGHDEEDPQ